jgi:tRNA (cmo5U34)-methyltransferase
MTRNHDPERETGWDIYRRIAPVAVPQRAEQLATLMALVPFGTDEEFTAVEVGCGEGHLSAAMATCWPSARITALDGSPAMLDRARARLEPFGRRVRVESFELSSNDWLPKISGAGLVVSSLCLHHLEDDGKKRLFVEIAARLDDRGSFLVADLVEPKRDEGRALFASMWNRSAHLQSMAFNGTDDLYQEFLRAEWNHYEYPDPMDTPSPLADQLNWLSEAGFVGVDCFWLQAGHAIFGGYKKEGSAVGARVDYDLAYRTASKTFG